MQILYGVESIFLFELNIIKGAVQKSIRLDS